MNSQRTHGAAMNQDVDSLLKLIRDGHKEEVVFDLDGTLTLLDMPWAHWTELVLAGLPASQRVVSQARISMPGSAWGLEVNRLIDEGSIARDELVATSIEFETAYPNHRPNHSLVAALLTTLPPEVRMYLWSSNTRATVDRVIKDLGLQEIFRGTVARDDVWFSKPHPEGWARLGLSSTVKAQLFVGDSRNDQLAADAVGVDYFNIEYF